MNQALCLASAFLGSAILVAVCYFVCWLREELKSIEEEKDV